MAGTLASMDARLEINTPIRTVEGWKRAYALEVGDRIYGSNGQPCTVLAAGEEYVPETMYRMRTSAGEDLEVGSGTTLRLIGSDAYYAWKSRREREGLTEYYPADWAESLSIRMTTDRLYRKAIDEGLRPENITWTQWLTHSECIYSMPLAPALEGTDHPDLPEDAYQVGVDLREVAFDYPLVDHNVIPRLVLNASVPYRTDVLRGLLQVDRDREIDKMDFMETFRDATIIDDVAELTLALGKASYLEPKRGRLEQDMRQVGVSKPIGTAERDGRLPTVLRRGPLHEGHVLLRALRSVKPELCRSIRTDSPTGLMLAGRTYIPVEAA